MEIQFVNAIPTVFKGIRLKSRLEADFAYLIENLGYKWLYEPQSYLLDNGYHYLPDFYVPELKLFIECRGYESIKGQSQIDVFAEMVARGEIGPDLIKRHPIPQGCEFSYSDVYNDYLDYLVIGPNDCIFYECTARYGVSKSDDATICECDSCKHWFFAGTSGSYQCRHCGRWDGNNHLIDMRWLWYDNAMLMGYRKTTIKQFIEELQSIPVAEVR